jgi:hypothetical protein
VPIDTEALEEKTLQQFYERDFLGGV